MCMYVYIHIITYVYISIYTYNYIIYIYICTYLADFWDYCVETLVLEKKLAITSAAGGFIDVTIDVP